MNLIDALALVLPMAKGYAHEHPVGKNLQKVQEAESVLEQAKAATPSRPRGTITALSLASGEELDHWALILKVERRRGAESDHDFRVRISVSANVPVAVINQLWESTEPMVLRDSYLLPFSQRDPAPDYTVARQRIREAGERLKHAAGAIPDFSEYMSHPATYAMDSAIANSATRAELIRAVDELIQSRRQHTAGVSGAVTTAPDDGPDQALVRCEHCTQFRCQEWHGQLLVKPRLVLRGGLWVCPKCGGSYGAQA